MKALNITEYNLGLATDMIGGIENHKEIGIGGTDQDQLPANSDPLCPPNHIVCLFCEEIVKKTQHKQKYCSQDCYHKSRIGKKMPPRSEEHCRKISESKKGTMMGEDNPFFGKKHTEETRKKISETQIAEPKFRRTGEDHWNWKGGVSKEAHKLRSCQELKIWRRAVYERDNYTCQECGDRTSKGNKVILNAHHIKPFMEYPELRFDVSNGITLCEECHKK